MERRKFVQIMFSRINFKSLKLKHEEFTVDGHYKVSNFKLII